MPTIRVQVRGKVATNLTPEEKLVCGNEDYEVEFDFDESWAGVNFKTGLFICNGDLIAQPFDGKICAVPRIENTTLLAVGVKSSDGRLFTTTPAFVDCLKSASDLATNKIPAPTKDVYDEIIALINKYIGQGGGGSGGTDEERVREIVAEETADLQAKSDENLQTESKEIVGAINELEGKKVGFTDYATASKAGVMKIGSGLQHAGNGAVIVDRATPNDIEGKTEAYKPIVPTRLDYAVKVGITTNKETLTSDEQLKAQKWLGIDDRFAVIDIALEQSGLLKKYKQPITQEYNERVTADGANVLDGSRAILKKVVGNTVACRNLVDEQKPTSKPNAWNYVDGVWQGINPYYNELRFELSVRENQSYVVSLELLSNSTGQNRLLIKDGATTIKSAVLSAGANAVQFTASVSGTYTIVVVGYTDGGNCYFKNLQVEEGTTATEYQPYFTGLKSASFGGIESTNADGTERNSLSFPITKMPLGKTIDFEAKKITDYGVDVVLTGNEKFTYYKYSTAIRNSIYVDDLSLLKPTAGAINTPYVSTDSVYKNSYYEKNVFVFLSNLTWFDILDTLGYTTAGIEPTAEEKATAVANFKAWVAQRYADGNPVTIRYVSSTLQSETDFTADKEYTAYKGGTEKVLDNDGAEYGAENTLTQDYIFVTEVK